MSRSIEMAAEGRTIRPPLVLPGRFCLGRPYGRFGQPGNLKPVRCVDGYCCEVGRPQPKELSLRKIKGKNWVKIVMCKFCKVIVVFIRSFVIRQVKVSFMVIRGIM